MAIWPGFDIHVETSFGTSVPQNKVISRVANGYIVKCPSASERDFHVCHNLNEVMQYLKKHFEPAPPKPKKKTRAAKKS